MFLTAECCKTRRIIKLPVGVHFETARIARMTLRIGGGGDREQPDPFPSAKLVVVGFCVPSGAIHIVSQHNFQIL